MRRVVEVLLVSVAFLVGCFSMRPSKTSFAVFRSASWEGVNLHGKQSSVQGFIDDLFFEIADRAGVRIDVKKAEERRVLPLLEKRGVDGVLSITVPTVQNQRVYEFSEPLFAFGPVLIIRSQDKYDSLVSLKDKVVGFKRGFGGDLETRNSFQIIFRPYDQMTYAMEDLINQKIDAVVLDSMYAHQLLSGLYARRVKIVRPPLKVTSIRLIVKKGENEELMEIFNKGFKELKKKNEYKDLLAYWGLFDPTLELDQQ
jgi:polar amino acid transport system substrate-binding protein